MTDTDYLTLTVWGEGRGERIESKVAIADVLLNRLRTGKWGHTYEAVATAKLQFSCWWPQGGSANYQSVMGIKGRLDAGQTIDDPVWKECQWAADGVSRGILRDLTGGATHYYEATLTPPPAWSIGHVPVAHIGGHLFFKGIP